MKSIIRNSLLYAGLALVAVIVLTVGFLPHEALAHAAALPLSPEHFASLAAIGMAARMPPNIRKIGKFDVNRANQIEAIWSPLYDYGAAGNYLAAGQTQLMFFQVPQGQSSKTLADTNMEIAGSLPAPKQLLVTSVQVCFWPAIASMARTGAVATLDGDFIKDVYTVFTSGFLKFFVGSKDYVVDAPLGVFPQPQRLEGWGAVSTGTGDATGSEQNYAAWVGPVYEIAPIRLISTQNFNVSLNWPTAVALPSAQAGRIGVRLGAYLYRLSQ